MELSELTSIIFALQDRVNFYWNLYIGGIALMAGWLVATEQPLSRRLKTFFSMGFVAFMVINWASLIGTYKLLEAFTNEFQLSITTQTFQNPELFPLVQRLTFKRGPAIATLVHLLLDVGVLYFLWGAPSLKLPKNAKD